MQEEESTFGDILISFYIGDGLSLINRKTIFSHELIHPELTLSLSTCWYIAHIIFLSSSMFCFFFTNSTCTSDRTVSLLKWLIYNNSQTYRSNVNKLGHIKLHWCFSFLLLVGLPWHYHNLATLHILLHAVNKYLLIVNSEMLLVHLDLHIIKACTRHGSHGNKQHLEKYLE